MSRKFVIFNTTPLSQTLKMGGVSFLSNTGGFLCTSGKQNVESSEGGGKTNFTHKILNHFKVTIRLKQTEDAIHAQGAEISKLR
jgi:hypothetical protein